MDSKKRFSFSDRDTATKRLKESLTFSFVFKKQRQFFFFFNKEQRNSDKLASHKNKMRYKFILLLFFLHSMSLQTLFLNFIFFSCFQHKMYFIFYLMTKINK